MVPSKRGMLHIPLKMLPLRKHGALRTVHVLRIGRGGPTYFDPVL